MNFLRTFAWGIVKPILIVWLDTRALQLPAADVAALAAQCDVTPDTILKVNGALKARALSEVDKFKP